jgi:hypothetical protein
MNFGLFFHKKNSTNAKAKTYRPNTKTYRPNCETSPNLVTLARPGG